MLDKSKTVDQLVAEHIKLNDWLASEAKRFDEHMKPFKEQLQMIAAQLLDLSNQQKWESIKTNDGTAYRSTLMNLKVDDRERLLDFAMEKWDEIGNEILLISAQKDAVKRWLEETGFSPPGVSVGYFTRINIRRS